MSHCLRLWLCVGLLVASPACRPKTIVIVVGQTGLSVVQAISQLQLTTKQLTDSGAISPQIALTIQEKLLQLNDKAKPLPEILRRLDVAVNANGDLSVLVDQAIVLLKELGMDLTTVMAGVPTNQENFVLLDLVRTTQQTIMTTLVESARLKGTP